MPMLINADTLQPQKLREYQQAAVTAIREAWAAGETAPLAALATGAGKTTILAQLLFEAVDPASQRALVIGHTEEIISQLYERIRNQFDGGLDAHFTDRFAPGIGVVMADNDAADARIVVATRQSLHPRRMAKLLQYGVFNTLLIDEAHHAFADNTYGNIVKAACDANPDLKIAGFTATPERGDGKALGSIFSTIVYQWLIPDGIAAGYLVPVRRVKVTTSVDVNDVKSSHGDYMQTKLVSVLETANWLDLAAQAFRQHITPTDRLCLAFLPSVAMSQAFAERMRAEGVAAEHLDGDTPKDRRRTILHDYKSGKVRLVSNVAVLTEGFDAPETGAILMAAPTRSRSRFTQIIGRGLRPYPGKHDCLLVDLAVSDVKALEVGSLLGRMTQCPKCGTEHYAGMKACPVCGHVVTWKQRVGAGMSAAPTDQGKQLLANYEALFEKSFAAWFSGEDGFFSCTLSFEDGAFLIVPPLEDNYYRLAHIPKDQADKVEYLVRNEDLASLMLEADERVQKKAGKGAQKDAEWRQHPASMAQIHLLSKLGVSVPEGLSKGAASQLITHALSVKRLMQE